MSRRQKGPTPEELISKLQESFDGYKLKNEESLESYKAENKVDFEQFKDVLSTCQNDMENFKSSFESFKDQNKQQTDCFDEKYLKIENSLDQTKESVTSLQKQLEEVEQKFVTVNDALEAAVEKFGIQQEENLKEINNKMASKNEQSEEIIGELKSEIKEDIANTLKALNEEQTMNQSKFLDINTLINESNQAMDRKIDEIYNQLVLKLENDVKNNESVKDGQDIEMDSLKDQVRAMIERVDDISEKMYEFEQNKKNNLLFYGIANDKMETPNTLLQKVIFVIKTTLSLRRDISLVKANRMLTGPEIQGSRPVVVTFETYKDKEDVLRKAGLLRGSNIHVTEDMNKKTRESRAELRKYMRSVKRNNPSANFILQYDKLYIDNKVFIWNDIQGKVIEHTIDEESDGNSPCPCSRPASVMTDSGFNSSLSFNTLRSPSKSPKKSFDRSQSLYTYNDDDIEEAVKEREDKIRELENIISRQAEIMKEMKTRLDFIENDDNNMSIESNES